MSSQSEAVRDGEGHEGHARGGHAHVHTPASFGPAFAIGITLNVAFVLVEVAYGLRAHSLALVADAGHNLSDVLGLLIAWAATVLSRRAPTPHRTYGLRGSSVLAALANAVFLLVAIGAIAWEAVGRFRRPNPVEGATVMVVAAIGIVINAGTALLFMRGRKHDLNIRGAFLHMAVDAGVSAGVVVAGAIVSITGALWVDPVVSLVIVAIVAGTTWGLLRDSVNLALAAVPRGIDPAAVEAYLAGLPDVREVHDLHIWGMSTTDAALTAHLVRPIGIDEDALLLAIYRDLHARFGIDHATIQIERGHGPHGCKLAPADVV